eukprot:scaffold3317_cov288-Prasinococcus_capsulatus_cf.AAC.5
MFSRPSKKSGRNRSMSMSGTLSSNCVARRAKAVVREARTRARSQPAAAAAAAAAAATRGRVRPHHDPADEELPHEGRLHRQPLGQQRDESTSAARRQSWAPPRRAPPWRCCTSPRTRSTARGCPAPANPTHARAPHRRLTPPGGPTTRSALAAAAAGDDASSSSSSSSSRHPQRGRSQRERAGDTHKQRRRATPAPPPHLVVEVLQDGGHDALERQLVDVARHAHRHRRQPDQTPLAVVRARRPGVLHRQQVDDLPRAQRP